MNNLTSGNSDFELVQYSTCPLVKKVVERADFADNSSLAISFINMPLSLSAFLGNLIILISLRKATSINRPTKLLFQNLAVTDLCIGFICQPLFSFHLMSIAMKRLDLCHITERAGYIPTVTLCGVSLLTVTAVSVDRLLVLLKGMRYRKVVTMTRVRILLIIIWVSSIFTGVSFVWNVRIFFGITCASIINCVLISTSSYVKIFLTLRREKKKVQDDHNRQPDQMAPLNAIHRYKKSVSTALWIHFALIACYLPYTTVKVITSFFVVTPSLLVVGTFMAMLVYLNSTLNPMLYYWRIREVRNRVKETICRI